jgi:hypothetical protein
LRAKTKEKEELREKQERSQTCSYSQKAEDEDY